MKTGCVFAGAVRASAVVVCGLLAATSGAAWAAPGRPTAVAPDTGTQVGEICRATLGLGPSEPVGLVWGAATMPGLTPGENHYQGCIASLSDTLRDAGAYHAVTRAASDHTERLGSFFTASTSEIRRRERLACARLGLDTDSIQFGRCVSDLSDTFFAIDNPQF